MPLHQRTRIIMLSMRCVVAALWLLGFSAMPSISTPQLLYLLPILALVSFFLVDTFAAFLVALLLTVVINNLTLSDVPGTTRALIVNAIWLAAIASVAAKLIIPHKPAPVDSLVDSLTTAQPATSLPPAYPPPGRDSSRSTKDHHDLQTPISSILGYCNAILRNGEQAESASPRAYHEHSYEHIRAIQRNARLLEKMLDDFFSDRPRVRLPEAESFEPGPLIRETVAMIRDLMAVRGLKLDVQIDEGLPRLTLHRVYIRQVLLNILRSFAREERSTERSAVAANRVTVRASVQHSALRITFTALKTSINQAQTDVSWNLNQQILEKVGGRLWIADAVDHNTSAKNSAYTDIILALPVSSTLPLSSALTANVASNGADRQVLVVSEESSVIDFFEDHLQPYRVTGIRDIRSLREALGQDQPAQSSHRPALVILTREQQIEHLQPISAFAGNDTPIMVCRLSTAQELLYRLNIVFIPKPPDYTTIAGVLMPMNASHILIVEDNIDNADLLAQMLTSMLPACTISKAYLAQDALTLLNSLPISAVMIDASLPDMDGVSLIQQIRAQERFAHLPIVLMSAHQHAENLVPISMANKITIIQPGGIDGDRLAGYVEAAVRDAAGAVGGPVANHKIAL